MFYWDHCLARAVRHSEGRRWRGRYNFVVIWPVSSVRRNRPCNTTQMHTSTSTVSMAPCFIGSNHISAFEDNRYAATPKYPLLPLSLVVFLKDPSLEVFSSTSGYSDQSLLWDYLTVVFGLWTRCLHWCRSVNNKPLCRDDCGLFCRTSPDSKRLAVTVTIHHQW